MRVIFMGSPDFSVPALRALHAAHQVVCVYAQPPKPANRGQHETPCPVHRVALELGLPVRTPARVRRDLAEHQAFAAFHADVAVVAAYGLILPRAMLDAPRLGCLNIHASLLPRWRGAAPIHAAVLHGDTESGITIMQMEEGLDTGPMLLRVAMPLPPRITTTVLHDALSDLGAGLILRALAEHPPGVPQPEAGMTYAPKLTKPDGLLDWREPAMALERRVRAMNPWPGAFFSCGADNIRVLDAIAMVGGPDELPASGLQHADIVGESMAAGGTSSAPGSLLAPGLVACGQGALRLLRLQRPGRAAMDTEAFLRGNPLPPRLPLPGTG